MANETSFNSISALVKNILDGTVLQASEQTAVQSLVRQYTGEGLAPREFSAYTGGTIVSLSDISDLSSQTFTPSASGTLTPGIYAAQYYITDARRMSDWNNVQADAALDLGTKLATKIDTSLVALFSSLTGGTVGSAGGTLTWANVQRAAAYIRANNAVGQVSCVLRPEHWYYLTSASSGVPTLMQSPEWMNSLAANYYQGSWGGINFFTDSNITSGTAAVAAMFHQDAMAFDLRKPIGIEVQRDASRGGGGYELNASTWFGVAVYRPTFGVQMIGTSS